MSALIFNQYTILTEVPLTDRQLGEILKLTTPVRGLRNVSTILRRATVEVNSFSPKDLSKVFPNAGNDPQVF